MSARETLPRPQLEDTQAMDLAEVQEGPDAETTAIVPAQDDTVVVPAQKDEETSGATRAEAVDEAAVARERRRAERDKALGTRRPAPEPEPEPVVETQPKLKRTTDKFFGSFGLFLLRLVAAAIIGLHGFAKALDITAVQSMLANTVIPEPVIMSYVLTGAEVAIALALLFGLFTRVAGFGLALIGIGALVFVHWLTNPFVGNTLTGELELLLGAVGLLFVFLGGGGWSVDAAFRRRRAAETA
ncbi:MAG: DoxX family protein [Propionibacteriaceae bacterium]|nr:DoxX family protein [Propionibacteriaceae bacterium]